MPEPEKTRLDGPTMAAACPVLETVTVAKKVWPIETVAGACSGPTDSRAGVWRLREPANPLDALTFTRLLASTAVIESAAERTPGMALEATATLKNIVAVVLPGIV